VVVGAGGRDAGRRAEACRHFCARLGLGDGATYADGANVLFKSLAGQTIQT
jgi:hypothetical protein